jgi:hypothetical protein
MAFTKLANWNVASKTLAAGSSEMKMHDEIIAAIARFEAAVERREGVGCVFSFKGQRISWARNDDGASLFVAAAPTPVTPQAETLTAAERELLAQFRATTSAQRGRTTARRNRR